MEQNTLTYIADEHVFSAVHTIQMNYAKKTCKK